jgi:hypothetical protein
MKKPRHGDGAPARKAETLARKYRLRRASPSFPRPGTSPVTENLAGKDMLKRFVPPTCDFAFKLPFAGIPAPPTSVDNEERKAKNAVAAFLEMKMLGLGVEKQKQSTGTFPLLALPIEIRHEIYRQVLIRPEKIDIFLEQWRMCDKAWPLWPLQMACKQLRDETNRYYFNTMRFNVSLDDLFNKAYTLWLPKIQNRGAAALRKMDFEGFIHTIRMFTDPVRNEIKGKELFTTSYRISLRLLNKAPWYNVGRADIRTKRRLIFLVHLRTDQDDDDNTTDLELKQYHQDFRQHVIDPILAIREEELAWTVWHMIQSIGIDNFGTKEITKLMDLAFERYCVTLIRHLPILY